MGESRGSEQTANSPDRRVVNRRKRRAEVRRSPNIVKKTLEKAAQAVLVGSAIFGGGKAVISEVQKDDLRDSVRISRQVKKDKNRITITSGRIDKSSVTEIANFQSKNSIQGKLTNRGVLPRTAEVGSDLGKTIQSRLIEEVFPHSDDQEKVLLATKVKMFDARLTPYLDYRKMESFLRVYSGSVERLAKLHQLDPILLKAQIFIESSGDSKAKSDAGAVGIGQLMEHVGRQYGLKINKNVDEREDPNKNLEVTTQLLEDLNSTFGDTGLAIWAYHAGVGNVMEALAEYFDDEDLRQYQDTFDMKTPNARLAIEAKARKLIYDTKTNVGDILYSEKPNVQKFLHTLEDDTVNYAIKVVAAQNHLERLNNYHRVN